MIAITTMLLGMFYHRSTTPYHLPRWVTRIRDADPAPIANSDFAPMVVRINSFSPASLSSSQNLNVRSMSHRRQACTSVAPQAMGSPARRQASSGIDLVLTSFKPTARHTPWSALAYAQPAITLYCTMLINFATKDLVTFLFVYNALSITDDLPLSYLLLSPSRASWSCHA